MKLDLGFNEHGTTYLTVIFLAKMKTRLRQMAHVTMTCSIENEKMNINPNSLSTTSSLWQKEFKMYVSFHPGTNHIPNFKDGMIRKPDKPSLFRDILKGYTNTPLPSDVCYVVDGGYSLHKVRWTSSMDVCDILLLFTNFLKS